MLARLALPSLLLLLLLLALTPVASPAAAPPCPPPPEGSGPVPSSQPGEALIACVGSQPLSETTYKHWYEVAVAGGSGDRHKPSPHELLAQVMGFLLSAAWVQGEAKALHVHVSRATVHRRFEQIRHEQFPRQRAFERFLSKSKQTIADLLMRVEVDMLIQRIQRHIAAGHHGAKAKLNALTRFVSRFRRKWTSQTYCAPVYAVRDCGHVQWNL
ncbi:MAG TPA: hypothetical protein VHU13_01410 [Solirubrobacteraceae bacterium]|nr:hypothetical protein [Solirubrobacteraceae bacterium]